LQKRLNLIFNSKELSGKIEILKPLLIDASIKIYERKAFLVEAKLNIYMNNVLLILSRMNCYNPIYLKDFYHQKLLKTV
jgi:hypothetical protein